MWRRGWFCPSNVPVCPPKRLSTGPTLNDKSQLGQMVSKVESRGHVNHVMPTTTLECYSVHTGTYTSIYTKNYIAYSLVHDPQGPDTGPPGFASREADPTRAGGSRLKGLRKVLLVVGRDLKKKKKEKTLKHLCCTDKGSRCLVF